MDAPIGSRRLAVGFGLLVIVLVVELYVYNLHFETRAKVLRLHFVLLLQVLFYLISKFIWGSLNFHSIATSPAAGDPTDTDSDDPKRWTLWRLGLLGYLVVCQSAYLTNYFLMGRDPHWYAVWAYCAVGSFIQLAFALAALRLASFCLSYTNILRHTTRRQMAFSKRVIAYLACSYAIVASSIGIYTAMQMPKVKRITVPIRGLTESWDNAKIVQISDIHLGPTVGFTRLSAIVDVISGLRPDLVVMTGDLVDGPVKTLRGAALPLRSVWSKMGNYFVTGNHEYYTGDVDNWLRELQTEMGFTPLHNTNVKLLPSGGTEEDTICLAGTDDIEAEMLGYAGHGLDLDKALKSCDQTRPVILLTHQPRAAQKAVHSQYKIDLILSGHTHGGQFFPVTFGAYLVNPFFAGLYKYGNSFVYVSQGTQFFGTPFRLGTTMEITEIILRAA